MRPSDLDKYKVCSPLYFLLLGFFCFVVCVCVCLIADHVNADFQCLQIPDQCRLDLTKADEEVGHNLLKEEFIKKNPAWIKELELMVL